MKPGEPIHTGMQVWHASGKTARVACLIVTCPPPEVTVTGDHSFTYVRLTPDDRRENPFDLAFDLFVSNYHRRLTAWERLDELNIEEPVYEGPLEGYFCIGQGVNSTTAIRIPKRERTTYESLTEEKNLVRSMLGSYAEWFEKVDPGCWKLVLDPAL